MAAVTKLRRSMIRKMRMEGFNTKRIAAAVGLARGTVRYVISALEQEGVEFPRAVVKRVSYGVKNEYLVSHPGAGHIKMESVVTEWRGCRTSFHSQDMADIERTMEVLGVTEAESLGQSPA